MPVRSSAVTALVFLAAMAAAAPAHASDRDPAKYPLRVHIFTEHTHRNHKWHYTYGHGQGNVFDGSEIHAMEYDFECDHGFLDSEKDEDYPAKWKKPGLSLELLIGIIGSETATRTCRLNVALKDSVYIRKSSGKVESISYEEYNNLEANRQAAAQALAPVDTDESHYPLQLSLLKLTWGVTTAGMHYASGLGNLSDGSSVNAVDLALACPIQIETTPEGRYLRAQWLQPGQEATLLVRGFGSPGVTCNIRTALHPDIYLRQPSGEVKAISQEQYRRIQASSQTPQ